MVMQAAMPGARHALLWEHPLYACVLCHIAQMFSVVAGSTPHVLLRHLLLMQVLTQTQTKARTQATTCSTPCMCGHCVCS